MLHVVGDGHGVSLSGGGLGASSSTPSCYAAASPQRQRRCSSLPARTWQALPEAAVRALTETGLIIYLPSAAAGMDLIPFELLRHPGGWRNAQYSRRGGKSYSIRHDASILHS